MRGLWRPFVVYGGLTLGVVAALVLVRGPLPDAAGYVAMPLAMVPLVALIVWRGVRAPARFLRGLADGGEVLEVVEDEVGWWGGRRTVANGVAGLWRLESLNGKVVDLLVQGPGDAAARPVSRGWREAGRLAALARLRPELLPPPRPRPRWVPRVEPAYRPWLAATLLGAGAALALGSAWGIAADVAPRALLRATMATGLGVAGFVACVGAFSGAWVWTERRAPRAGAPASNALEALGRRGSSALLLVGLAGGLAAMDALLGAASVVAGAGWPAAATSTLALAAACATLAFGVLAEWTPFRRVALTLAAALGAVSAYLLPVHFLSLVGGALAGLALVFAWMPDGERA